MTYNTGMGEQTQEQKPDPESFGQRVTEKLFIRMWRIVKNHKLKSILVVLTIWIGLEILTLPFGDVRSLKAKNPGETAFMQEHRERAVAAGRRFRVSQQWVPLSRVPKHVINAVIVAEDGSFWIHNGFDWDEFKESVEQNLKERRAARGASTITQQLVKNLYLSSSKNPMRKLREWILTWWMEEQLGKRRILELYLNVIEWGNGIYGVQAAAQRYFGKNVDDLTREEAARLAATIPNPRRYRADAETHYLVRKSGLILERMAARGL
ncbi:MAG: monofunctional biosynthetic peptidoglycan transglycosylase [Ignavibacteriales bacterium]|nr:monofunctional biosynthetic peptidoglycan transglycosylase [Ignavibacteriales bacterium]